MVAAVFNLLMFNVEWVSRRVTVPVARMFEFTDDHVADQFRQSGSPLLDRLTALPFLFCEEGTTSEVAYVGQINRARVTGRDLSLEVTFDSEVPPLPNRMIYANRSELD